MCGMYLQRSFFVGTGGAWCDLWNLQSTRISNELRDVKGTDLRLIIYNLYVDADCMHCMRFLESKKGLRVLGADQTDKYINKRHIRSFHSGICSRLWKIVAASTMTRATRFRGSCWYYPDESLHKVHGTTSPWGIRVDPILNRPR
jgi:hypothetical protein